MRLNAVLSALVLTAANPPVSSESVRRLSCDSRISASSACCGLRLAKAPIATSGAPEPASSMYSRRHADQAARVEREEVHVGACRGGDGVFDRADDVGGRVDAVDLVHRHLEPFAEEQHGLAPAADAGHEARRGFSGYRAPPSSVARARCLECRWARWHRRSRRSDRRSSPVCSVS